MGEPPLVLYAFRTYCATARPPRVGGSLSGPGEPYRLPSRLNLTASEPHRRAPPFPFLLSALWSTESSVCNSIWSTEGDWCRQAAPLPPQGQDVIFLRRKRVCTYRSGLVSLAPNAAWRQHLLKASVASSKTWQPRRRRRLLADQLRFTVSSLQTVRFSSPLTCCLRTHGPHCLDAVSANGA